MTPEMALEAEQEQREANSLYEVEYHDWGAQDASIPIAPQSDNPAYLQAYGAALRKSMQAGFVIELRLLSSSFVSGGYDDPHPSCTCDEF
jgi:hypothetical protein